MATLIDYQALDLYAQGQCVNGDDFVLGFYLETWIKFLAYQQDTPAVFTVDAPNGAVADDETLDLATAGTEGFTLYQGDTLYFPTDDVLVLLTEDVVVPPLSAPVTANVAPLTGAITATETATTYALFPIISAVDGGTFNATGTSALARTKVMRLNPARTTSERDGSISVSGQLNVKDPAMFLLDKQSRRVERAYIETRYSPFVTFTDETGSTVDGGRGVNAIKGSFTFENWNPGANRGDYITFDSSFTQAGCVDAYLPLGATA